MEGWHHALATELFSPEWGSGPLSAASELEIAFGLARTSVAFVLEIARAHRLAATGNASGDAIWLQLGHGRVRVTLNRREASIVVRSLHGDSRLRWDDTTSSLVDADGGSHDLELLMHGALEELVAAWKLHPAQRLSSAPPPELDDEPTKG